MSFGLNVQFVAAGGKNCSTGHITKEQKLTRWAGKRDVQEFAAEKINEGCSFGEIIKQVCGPEKIMQI